MRNSSATKKRHEYDKYVESRVLITSNSLNPLSKHISTKLDLIKQQISRQFHEKFPSDKKRTTSVKKNSSSKSKLPQYAQRGSVSKKLNFNNAQTPSHKERERASFNINTEHQSQNQSYRQKFYELQDKFMAERKKMIEDYEKSSNLRQKVMDFLEEPSPKTGEQLREFFPNDRHRKVIEKFTSMSEDVEFAEKTLSELLSIVEVEDIQTLLSQLKTRQQGYKNLSECSFKILELETAYNKLQKESQQKIQELQTKSSLREQQIKNQFNLKLQNMENLIQTAKKQQRDSLKFQLNELIQKILQVASNTSEDGDSARNSVMFVTFDKIKKEKRKRSLKSQTSLVQEQSLPNLLDKILHQFIQMARNVQEIQKEAEQNMEKLMVSKHDLDRLEKLIQNVTYETQEEKHRLIEHFEQVAEEKEQQFMDERTKLQAQLAQERQKYTKLINERINIDQKLQKQVEQAKLKCQKLNQILEKKENILLRLIKIICDTTGQDVSIFGIEANQKDQHTPIQETAITKIEVILKKHLLALKENLQAAENMITWHEKQLEIKQALLKQFDFNLKKLLEEVEVTTERERKLLFERDEYKYLLNNLRENVRELKNDHEQQLAKLERKKDEEYLTSSADILTDNKRLTNQIAKLQENISELKNSLASQSAAHQFHLRKSQQFQSIIIQLRKKLTALESESTRYKQHLTEIQASFKEVQSMSQINSQKMIGLQEQNKLIVKESTQLRDRLHRLMADIDTKDQKYNKLKFAHEELEKKYDVQSKNKEHTETENSQLRLNSLQLQQQLRAQQQRAKKIGYQNNNLTRQNKKLMEQLNTVTKKLLVYVGQKSMASNSRKQIVQQLRQEMQDQVGKLRGIHMNTKILVKDQLDQFKVSLREDCEQVLGCVLEYEAFRKNQRKQEDKKPKQQENCVYEENHRHIVEVLKKKITYTKDQMANLKEYCKYIKKEFDGQLKHVAKMIDKPGLKMVAQSQNISNNWDTLMKMKLMLNSLKNEGESMKETIQSNRKAIGQMLEQVQQKLVAQPKDQPNEEANLLQPLQQQQLHKYINSSDHQLSPKNEQPEPFAQQYMSPQFRKTREPIEQASHQNQDEGEEDKIQIASNEENNKNNNNKNNSEGYQLKINSDRAGKPKVYSFKMSSSQVQDQEKQQDQLHKLRWSGLSIENEQAQRVKKILISLKDNQSQQPKIPYFELIKSEYRIIKKRLLAKILALDISAVSFRHNTVSSPSSVSFSKDFLFDKRFNTEPNQQLPMHPRQTNRSVSKYDTVGQPIRIVKENEELNKKIQQLLEQLSIYYERQQEYKIKISELEKEKTELQNEASKEMKEKLFLKFIGDLCKQNWKEVQNSCKIILKLLGLSVTEINQKMEALKSFIIKHEKKSSGFMGGLFQKSPSKPTKS